MSPHDEHRPTVIPSSSDRPCERTVTATMREFRPAVEEVREARHFAEAAVEEWGICADAAVLIVGELAANSQRHARSWFSVLLDYVEGVLLIEVTDASPVVPQILATPSNARTGRGLVIVERIARSWGTRLTSFGGKTVWVELDIHG